MFDYQVAHVTLANVRKTSPTYSWLEKQVGGLSKPSKMPWFSYSIPASKCKVGSILRDVEGSVCSKCYARKGRYNFHNTQTALTRRYNTMTTDYAKWAGHMVHLLGERSQGKEQWFRWHDSGDLQSKEHLEAIIWIAQQLPRIHFWLPTKERKLVNSMATQIETARNLTVRVSAPMVGQVLDTCQFPTSSVGAGAAAGCACLYYKTDGKCGPCRACWDKTMKNVNYPEH
jgi:hypothetical protein